MNVFLADADPASAARALADRHVVKMVVETAQILSTVCVVRGLQAPYRATHRRHPCIVAAGADPGYRAWVALHGRALAAEYAHRYGRTHGASGPLDAAISALDALAAEPSLVGAPLAMPDEHRGPDPVDAYRRYLRAKYAAWGPAARWTRRDPPAWWAP